MIQLKNISLNLGPINLFEDVNCIFGQDEHIGIIGRNGAGKSTLLKIIAGKTSPSSGEVNIKKNFRIGYLSQDEVLNSKLTVFDEAFSAFEKIINLEKRLNELENIISSQDINSADINSGNIAQDSLTINNIYQDNSKTNLDNNLSLIEEYGELQLEAKSINKHEAVNQTKETLFGLGFKEIDFDKPVSSLSTGWKMRLGLAKLLLSDADMFLFDEPTNHLDIVTQAWLLQKLRSMRQGFLLVSHDRAYLEKACNSILEIERSKATYYKGNLSSYLEQKEKNIEIAKATRERQEKDIAQKQATIERFRYSASKARQAQNMIKQLERIELVEVEPPLPKLSFKFRQINQPGSIVLTFNDATKSFGDNKIFSSISGEVQKGERVALVAANGVGKSTLIKSLLGKHKLDKGSVKFGHNVKTAFFEQDQAESLNYENTIFDELCENCPKSTELEIRQLLGAFLFSGDDIFKQIKVLSGGEKNRVAMARLLLQQANFLVLDEPTNHLDLYSKDILSQALLSYNGTILFVSHDYDFVNRLANRIIELTPDKAYSYLGTYEEYCEVKKQADNLTNNFKSKNSIDSKSTNSNNAINSFANNSAKSNAFGSSNISNNSSISVNSNTPNNYQSTNKKPNIEPEEAKKLRKKLSEIERQISKLEQSKKKELSLLETIPQDSAEYLKSIDKLVKLDLELSQTEADWEQTMLELN